MDREGSNREAAQRLTAASPVLVDIRPAAEVVPGMTANTVLTAGLPLPWDRHTGLQRQRIVEAAVAAGLASAADEVDRLVGAGEIAIGSSYQHGCIGPGLAVCTAATPVFVVEDRAARVFSAVTGPDLPTGSGAEDARLLVEVVVPVMREAIERAGGLPLQPLVAGAQRLGDELHLRAAAGATLFTSSLFPALLAVGKRREEDVRAALAFMDRNGAAWFVRLALAAARAIGDAAHGVAGSTLVTGVVQSCRECAIRISGLADEWFSAPLPAIDGEPIDNPGGDSVLADPAALGDAGPARKKAVDPATLAYWSMKPGLELFKGLGTGIGPILTGHAWSKAGGLTGAVTARVPIECLEAASDAYRRQYMRKR